MAVGKSSAGWVMVVASVGKGYLRNRADYPDDVFLGF
jgi:hypothetical protein